MPENKKCQFKPKWFERYACPEPPLQGSDYCIFHKAEKTKYEGELFRDKINKKLQNKDYDFRGYYFPTEVTFRNQAFQKVVCFEQATFERAAGFGRTIFHEDAEFMESTFKEYADFRESTFKKSAFFLTSTFEISALFDGTTFEGNAQFVGSTFVYAGFSRVTFKGNVDLGATTFKRFAGFERVTFGGDANLDRSIFEGSARFERVIFKKGVRLEGLTFGGSAVFVDINFKNNAPAGDFFRIVKACYQRQGDYTRAGEYYYKERIAKRKQLPWYSHKRWFEYLLLDGLCGYGERPLRAIRTGLGVLFGLALLYWKVGHIYPSPGLFKEPDHALTFLDALYFSVVTFTTLGFGDWRPDPSHWIRYVVMSEAFIGAFLMALFIVTFARRMMR